jgi:hypothetical protein
MASGRVPKIDNIFTKKLPAINQLSRAAYISN